MLRVDNKVSGARRISALLSVAAKEFFVDGGLRLAAALSYYTLFSLIPLLFVGAAIAGYVFGDPDAVRRAVDQATDLAGAEVGNALEDLLFNVQAQRNGALSIGVILAAFAAAGIFQQVQAVLALVFHVPEERRRDGPIGWLVRRMIGTASAIVLAVLVLAPIAAVGAIDWLIDQLPGSTGAIDNALNFVVPMLSVAMLMLVTALTFQALTAVQIPWRAAVRGGAATALLGVTAAFLVGIYLNSAVATAGTLGALGGVAILLFFFYLMWTVYVYGAEVTKVYSDFLRHGDIMQPSERTGQSGSEPGETTTEERQPNASRSFFAAALLGFVLGRRWRS